jgi:hypothetical protein
MRIAEVSYLKRMQLLFMEYCKMLQASRIKHMLRWSPVNLVASMVQLVPFNLVYLYHFPTSRQIQRAEVWNKCLEATCIDLMASQGY